MAASSGRDVERDVKRLFRLDIIFGLGGLFTAVVALAAAARSVQLGATAAHRVVVADHDFTYPQLNFPAAIVLGLAGVGLLVVVVTAASAAREIRTQRRFLRVLRTCVPLDGHPHVLVIDDPHPQAFCAGYWRPRVYVSAGVLGLLDPAARTAMLAHELHHRACRDPVRLAVLRVLGRSLFFLPAIRAMATRYAALAELAADRAAVKASDGDPAPLARAMLASGAVTDRTVVGIAPERVDQLLGSPPRWRVPFLLLGGALMTIICTIAVDLSATATASVQTTLNVPLLSSQPCILVLAIFPAMVGLGALLFLRRLSAELEGRDTHPKLSN